MNGQRVWSVTVTGYTSTSTSTKVFEEEGVLTKRVMMYPIPRGWTRGDIRSICWDHGTVNEIVLKRSYLAQYPSHAVVVMSTVEEATTLSTLLNGEEAEDYRLRTVQLREREWEIKQRLANQEAMRAALGTTVET